MLQKILLALIATYLILSFGGCAHKKLKEVDLDECLSDPAQQGFQCSGVEATSAHFIPYKDSAGYVARKPEADQAFWEQCFLERRGMTHP